MIRKYRVGDKVRLTTGQEATVVKVLRIGYRIKFEPGHSIAGHSHFRITRFNVAQLVSRTTTT